MAKKSRFLKNLLTSASAVAVLAAGACSAEAAVRTTTGSPAVIGVDNGLGAFVSGVDTIQLGAGHNLQTGGAVDLSVGPIDINGNANQTFTVSHAVTYGAGVNLDMALVVANGGSITIQDITDAADDVTVQGNGVLVMRDAAHDLLANGGTTTVHNVARDVTLANGAVVNQSGTVGRNLAVGGAALYVGGAGADVTGTVTINTTNVGINTLNDAGGAVLLTQGKLTMNDATAGGADVTVANNAANVLVMNDAARDLLANGGTTTVRNVARDVTLANGAVVNQSGTVGRNLDVAGAALYVGGAGADVTGTVTINTTNVGINTLHNAGGAVTVNRGQLVMNNAGAGLAVSGAAGAASATVAQVTGAIDVNQGGVATVSGNVTGAINNTNGANVGIVNLTGVGDVGGAIGATNPVTKISVSGNRTFSGAAFGNDGGGHGLVELNFAAADKKVTLAHANAGLLATNVTLDQDGDHVIEMQAGNLGAQAIDGAINAAGKMNAAGDGYGLTIKVMGGAVSDVTVNNADFKANLASDQADKVTAIFGANVAGKIGNLGSQAARFLDVTFNQNAELTVGDIYSQNTHVGIGKKVKFAGRVIGDITTLNGLDSQAKYVDGAVIDTEIHGTGNEGLVEFEGGVTINKAITGGARVRFSDAAPAAGAMPKVALINKNIDATAIEGRETLLVAASDATITGRTVAKRVGAEAGKTLRFNGGVLSLEGDVNVYSKITTTAGKTQAGQVIAEDNANPLDLTTLNSTLVVIDDASVPVNGRQFTLFQNETGGHNGEFKNIALKDLNENSLSLWKWEATSDADANIVITQIDNSAKKLEENLGSNGGDAVDVSNIKAAYSNPGIAEEIAGMTGPEGAAARTDLAKRLVVVNTQTVISDITSNIGTDLGTRMGTLAGLQGSPAQNKVVSVRTTGTSAGDDANRYGAWISPFFNKSTQKSRKGAAGYAASIGGGSFGFDTKANDDMIVGLALSMLQSDIKHKNFKTGDKTKVDSIMFSIYGMQQITDNWFGQAIVTAGSSKVTNKEKRRVSNTDYQTATGKYTSMSFSGEALLGYNYVMDQVSITPMGGIRLSRVNDAGYKETGTTNQNLSVARKALDRAELIFGARVAGGTFDLNGLSVTPEIHGFLNQDLMGKKSRVDVALQNGAKLEDRAVKPNKSSFNLGVGLNATYNAMEYGIGYDAHLATKFIGHQGTLKVRVNF